MKKRGMVADGRENECWWGETGVRRSSDLANSGGGSDSLRFVVVDRE